MSAPRYWVVMPAAGVGRRLAGEGLPKQYRPLAGRTVIEHALAPFLADPQCVGIVVALGAADDRFAHLAVSADGRVRTTTGGAERRDSVLAGLDVVAALSTDDPWVLVHDAARPCLPVTDLQRLCAALETAADGALLALPVADTVKRADAQQHSVATVPRDGLWCAQTPQAFRLQSLRAALVDCAQATDEASAMEQAGYRPLLVAGSADNLKITRPGDLEFAALLLARRTTEMLPRIGFGIDVHAFGDGDHVWLGGVRIPHSRGVVAHSDGDVLLHALCDALLGAAGLGDIGQHFPDTDARFRGAASVEFVRHVMQLLRARGWRVGNADLTLLSEAPRVAPYREQIRAAIAAELGVGVDAVNLKATTTERLGALGRREGLAAEAAVLIVAEG